MGSASGGAVTAGRKEETNGYFSCDECGSGRLETDHRRGERTCRACGVVAEEEMIRFERAERVYHQEEVEERVHDSPTSVLHHDKKLGSEFRVDADAYGESLGDHGFWRSIHTWNERSKYTDPKTRGYITAVSHIKGAATRLHVPGYVRDRAIMLFKEAQEEGVVKGRSLEGMAGAVLYHTCKEEGLGRPPEEIASAVGTDEGDMMKGYRGMGRGLEDVTIRPASPGDYVPRITNRLDLSTEAGTRARQHASELDGTDVSGRSPSVIATTLVYMASLETGEYRTQKEISEAAGISELSVRNNLNRLAGRLEMEDVIEEYRGRNGHIVKSRVIGSGNGEPDS